MEELAVPELVGPPATPTAPSSRSATSTTSASPPQLRGSTQYGITCTALAGATPCGWDDFTTDRTTPQPTGKWVGEAEYSDDNYVCNPGQSVPGRRRFAAFCRDVYAPSWGFAAVKFDVNLDGGLFYPCPTGT